MYLGQERWNQGGQQGWGGRGQQQQQQQQQQQPARQGGGYGGQQAAPQAKEIGDVSQITVSGCNHGVVGPIVCGNYTLTTLNHGKPAYKKEQQQGRPDVMLYFWDERDGAASSGWWLSPKIGSEVVWGFHPNRAAQTPPTTGWKVPYDGGVDPNFLITPQRGGGGGRQQPVGAGAPSQSGGGIRLNGAAEAKQQEMMRQQEQRRQADENNKKRLEEQRKKQEEQRKQAEEAAKKQKEEQAKRLEQMRKQQEQMREERRAVAAIRAVFQKLRTAKADDFESLEAEMHIILDKELENCGGQKTAIKEESTKCLEQAKTRVAALQEQKKKMEEKRAEEEKKKKEAQEVAEKLLGELEELVAAAESSAEALKQAAEKFKAKEKFKKVEEVATAAKDVTAKEADAQETTKAAQEFVTTNRAALTVSLKTIVPAKKPDDKAKEEGAEEKKKPTLPLLQQRLTMARAEVNKTMVTVNTEKAKKEKRIAAQAQIDQGLAAFKKYDKDKDGALSKKEIEQYAKGECGFTLPSESLDLIFEVLVKPGAKGVNNKDIQRLKVMVGVARERERDQKRNEDRLAHEKEVAEAKAALVEKVKELSTSIDSSDEALKKAEELVKTLPPKAKATEVLEHVAKVDEALKAAKDLVATTTEKTTALNSNDSPEHRPYVRGELRRLQKRTGAFEARISKTTSWLKKARSDAKKRAAEELDQLRQKALKAIWAMQQAEKLKTEALLKEFGIEEEGEGSVSQEAFLGFFSRCEERRKEASDDDKEKLPESPDAEELKRLYTHLCEDGAEELAADVFQRFSRRYMKVLKDAVITQDLDIKGKMVRRLEIKEVVEVLEGPVKEDTVGVERVSAKAMSDGATGWITICGNQGARYLVEGGGVFKVVKETILTGSFELDAPKDVTRKLHDTTRKLQPDELVEVHEWPKLEEASGLTRMKCRAKSDGVVGWVTTVGNGGTTFLEVA